MKVRILSFLHIFLLAAASIGAQVSAILPEQELKDLLANAKTAADYQRLARHFQAKAAELEKPAAGCCQMMGKDSMKEMKQAMKEKMKAKTQAKIAEPDAGNSNGAPPAEHQH